MKFNISKYIEKPLIRQILIAAGPLIQTVSLGMTSGFSAILLPQTSWTKSEASWIASIAALPMTFGGLLSGFLMEKFGRKTTQILTTFPAIFGWIIIALAPNLTVLLIGRFLTGVCGGLLGASTGVYISEISEPRFRDFLLGGISLSVALGLFLVHLLGTFFSWQLTAGLSAVLPIISLVILCLVPESAVWLLRNNRLEDAQAAFFWYRGSTDSVKKEFDDIRKQNESKEKQTVTIFDRAFLKPLIIITVFIVTNQWAGVNALTFYTVSIIQDTVNEGIDNYLAMLIVDVIRVIMSVIACIAMKKLKRRPLALISGLGTALSLFILTLHSHVIKSYPVIGTSWYSLIPMSALITYIVFVSLGFVPLPWAMMGEVFPVSTRNLGSSISSFVAFLAFFAVVKTNPLMTLTIGVDGTFFVYGLVALLGTIFVWVFLPETQGKSLEQIEEEGR